MNSSTSSQSMPALPTVAELLPKPAEIVTLPSYMDCHDHAYTQVVIGLKGQAEFEVCGQGNLVGPGQGCIVTATVDHAFGSSLSQSDILVLNMPTPTNHDPLLLNKINNLEKSNIYFQLDGEIQRLIQMLVSEIKSNPEDLFLSRACNDTVIALLQRHLTVFEANKKTSRFDLDIINHYINQHLAHKITVTQLAGRVFLGESQFHHLFKQHVGMTPHQYVLEKRLEHAKTLMKQNYLSLGQVAELSGFTNQSSFTHTFTRLFGVSPSAYKKQLGY